MKTGMLAIVVAVALAGLLPAGALAELAAPLWMPNSPIMAGAQVILLWLPVPNAVKYNIYMNGKKIGESPSVQHMMASPTEAGDYSLQIAGVDGAGAEGPKSASGVIKIITIEPPGSVIGRAVDFKVQLRWEQAKGAVIYNIYRADKEGAEGKLVASVQGDAHTDAAVQQGKAYFYTVSSKDLAGKESPRSKPFRIDIPVQQIPEKMVKVELKVVATKAITESLFLGSKKIQMFGDMKLGPDGNIYVVDSGQKHVLKIDGKSLDPISVFPATPEEKEKLRRPYSLAFASDGRILLVDSGAREVFVFDGSGKIVSSFPVPDPTDKDVLNGVLPHLRAQGTMPTGIYIDEKDQTIYITDPRFNTIYRFDLGGKFLGTLGHGGDPSVDLAGPSEVLADRNGTDLYVTQPLSHLVAVIDKKTAKIKRLIGKKSSGFIGGFIGMKGINYDPEGNLVITDAGVHSIQVFDGKTGDYLYHFGDETGTPDPTMKERALLGIEMPNASVVNGNTLYVFRGDRMNVASREIVKKK